MRVDAGYEAGDTVSEFYDDLLGKLVAWAPDRDRAIARMRAALDDLAVDGQSAADSGNGTFENTRQSTRS